MAKYYYNGVLLPEIPDDVLTEFPYCWIRNDDHNLIVSGFPWHYKSGSLYISESSENRKYTLSETKDEWVLSDTYTDTGGYQISSKPLWSSHDIPNGSATATEIYFEGSEPVPEEPEEPEYAERYSILGSILVGTARQIMRLTDSTKKVKPEEFEAKLESVSKGGGGTTFVSSASGGVPNYETGTATSMLTLEDMFESTAEGELTE